MIISLLAWGDIDSRIGWPVHIIYRSSNDRVLLSSLPKSYPSSSSYERMKPGTSCMPAKPAEVEAVLPALLVDISRHVDEPDFPYPLPARIWHLGVCNVD